MRLVVHTLGDRRVAALAEARRVLASGGRLFIWTFAPEHFTGHHLVPYLPDLAPMDLARFPVADVLSSELNALGFSDVRVEPFEQTGAVTGSAQRSNCAPGTSRRSISSHPTKWLRRSTAWNAKRQPASLR